MQKLKFTYKSHSEREGAEKDVLCERVKNTPQKVGEETDWKFQTKLMRMSVRKKVIYWDTTDDWIIINSPKVTKIFKCILNIRWKRYI